MVRSSSLGHYKLLEKLGAGGMGEVWLAEDTRLLRQVAIKILPPALVDDEEAKARLIHEARTAAQLHHPNVALIYAFDEADGCAFLVMEYVEGASLTKAIERKALNEAQVLHLAAEIVSALIAAHGKGIIHRDIKPDNIIFNQGKVKVLDFGIAKFIDDATSPRRNTPHTRTGLVLGTVHYMSPEQVTGKTLDARTDIYSLGVILYQAVSGQLPFSGGSLIETMMQIIRDEPIDIANAAPHVSPQLALVIRTCMQKERERRYSNAKLLLDALDAIGLGLPPASARTVDSRAQATRITPVVNHPASAFSSQRSERDSVVRALIVDDDPGIRRLLRDTAARQQIRADEAANGVEGVALLKENDYAMIFVDLMMPRLDGWGLIDYLRSRPATSRPYVFIITAFGQQKISAVERTVVSGIIYKPFDIPDIARLMSECARGREGTPRGTLLKTDHEFVNEFFEAAR